MTSLAISPCPNDTFAFWAAVHGEVDGGALLEPVMMVVLGGTVGGLLVAMYLPIFKIAETIG